jgi:glycosyltransferase involved in cell wall biosynthesis
MINICICTDLSLETYHGGVDRIINFARSVSKNGANVFLVDRSRKKTISALLLDEDKYYRVEDGILREHVFPFYIRFLFPGLTKLLQEILNKILSIFSRTHAAEVTLFYAIDPYLTAKLFFVCKKESIDLIQCEFPWTIFPSFVVKEILRIPLIYDAHNIESERLGSMANISKFYITLATQMEIEGANLSDFVFVVSEKDKQQLISLGISRNKIEIIPNSVEIDKFSAVVDGSKVRNKHKLDGKMVLIFHGALGYPPNKEATAILLNNIMPAIQRKYPSSGLLLVGRDPPKTLPPSVLATGFVENLPEYIAAADIAIVPLLRGGGTKIKMLEYMACGKAIVSTVKAAEGLDLENERDALICKYPDAEFTGLVLRAIEDSDLRKRIGESARTKVERFYDWKKNSKKAVDVYHSLVCM